MTATDRICATKPPRGGNPFQRLRDLLGESEPGKPPITLTIGEPKHEPPAFVGEVLSQNIDLFRKYPPVKGSEAFRASVGNWLVKRFNLQQEFDADRSVIPLNGSREGLVFACTAARDYWLAKGLKSADEQLSVILPNPYYHSYGAGAHMAGAEAVLLPEKEDGTLPVLAELDPKLLERTIAFYFASPANPQGTVAPLSYWRELIGLARQYNFFIFADECYSEIYRDEPPVGALEAADSLQEGFANVVVFNSLSKRSNLPGLRCGFAAGDPDFIAFFTDFRNVAAPQVPLPVQAVACRAFADENHVIENRRLYNEKYALAEEMLAPVFGPITCAGGFFIWLNVHQLGGGVKAAKLFWEKAGLRVVPGEYLASAMPDGQNPGADFVRIALVENLEVSREAFQRILTCME
ncbi:aminotransferase class I/II-fold pyridoxal phosphate-dependent enzyme [Polycladidibacter stylochi]|uniref:aminotransferase class I/II-fold pyridoxal phosphate-dependent enzyme n=1 Tax=Polycladidibacter stylochi TaxID=1807766 RepID=UPI0009EA9D2F|nr:aminotransferase class I/II-fold pyridoxal phosphate-dependent enzyme [Pseudovibrio stylochi]